MSAFKGELLRGEAIGARLLVEHPMSVFKLIPVAHGRQIDLKNAGVGGQAESAQAGIVGRGVALDPNRHAQKMAGVFNRGDEVEEIGGDGDVGEKDMQTAVALLNAERWTNQLFGGFSITGKRRQRIGRGLLVKRMRLAGGPRW